MGEQGEGECLVARDPERRRDADRGQLERPDVARTGRDDRDQRDAARDERGLAQRQLDADRLAGRDRRADRRRPGDRAPDDGGREDARLAGDRQPFAKSAGELQDARPAVRRTDDPVCPGSRWSAIASARPTTSSATNAKPSRTALDSTPRTLRTTTDRAASPTTMTVSTIRSTTTVPRTVVRLTPSPSPRAWLRTSSPSRAGRTLFAR